MSNVVGIEVRFQVGGGAWRGSTDEMYLGVFHRSGGGREFALQTEHKAFGPGEYGHLLLGQACCDEHGDADVHVVNGSAGWGWNGPRTQPINLGQIEHVYLRKRSGDSKSDDDFLVLNSAEILACDSDGNLRRWRSKPGVVAFAYEVGLQHWLAKSPPPMCGIEVTLEKVVHTQSSEAGISNPAGYDWTHSWSASANGHASKTRSHYHRQKSTKTDKWTVYPAGPRTVFIGLDGCCPQDVDLDITFGSVERDRRFQIGRGNWFSNVIKVQTDVNEDDRTTSTESLALDCGSPSDESEQTRHYTQTVAPNPGDWEPKNRKSVLDWHFTVRAICG